MKLVESFDLLLDDGFYFGDLLLDPLFFLW